MKYSALILVFFALTLSLKSLGQCSKKAEKLLASAKESMVFNQMEAIESLEKALSICPQSEEISFLLADLYLEKKSFDEMLVVMNTYYRNNSTPKAKAQYFLALALQHTFRFDEAIKNYEEFLNSSSTNRTLRLRSINNIEHARFSKLAYSSYPNIDFYRLDSSINTSHSEYLLIMTAAENQLIFTRREGATEETYSSKLTVDSNWSNPTVISSLPAKLRKAAMSISVDGNAMVFAMADHIQGQGNFDIYFTEKINNKWSQPENLGPLVNTPGWESQPCISADGRTVYFSTDRKGGEGGYDIWKTVRQQDGTWQTPTNLGTDINSAGNEESPFIHRDQRTLYFRSDGHPGLGDFDIFMSRKIRFKKWTDPVNLGYPVNTIGNDGSLFVSLDGEKAFIASNVNHNDLKNYKKQSVLTNTDIYSFQLEEKFRPIPTTYTRLLFVDATNSQPVEPEIYLIDFVTNDTLFFCNEDEFKEIVLCLPKPSTYALSVQLKGYLPHYERFEPKNKAWKTTPLNKTISLSPIPSKVDTGVSEPIVLNNILFETNSTVLLPGSLFELEKLFEFLKRNSKLEIIIQGHTDNVGDESYNLTLSSNRAKVVFNYLIEKGISEVRLEWKGYGETKPIASNETEEGRQKNRRTEFVIKKASLH